MTTIRCPVCSGRVAGEGTELTHALRDHLADDHRMADLCMSPENLYSDPPRPREGYIGVLCPICAAFIMAPDGEVLTEGVRAHFGNVHGIRPDSLLARLRR